MFIRYIVSIVLTLLITSAFDVAYAQSSPGDLMVAPTKAIFEGRNRSTTLNLVNRGSKEATYRISFKNMGIDENGKFVDITEPVRGEKFADKLVRYSPRQITLKPGEAQTVRLMVRKPKDLEAGEYRSHLLFKALPPESLGDDIEKNPDLKEGEISLNIIPIFGISIPVLVRHGDVTASGEITDINLVQENDKNILSFNIERSGNMSLTGNIEVIYHTTDGSEYILIKGRRATVLYPYANKEIKLQLQLPEGVTLNKGSFTINYTNTKDSINKFTTTATYSLP